MGNYKRKIDLIKDGQAIDAGSTNKPTRELGNNVQYLKDLVDMAAAGETVFAREVTVAADVNVGMPVYYRASTRQFEKALAGTDTDIPTGTLLTSESAGVWGVVYAKHNATLADLLLLGYAELDLSHAVTGDVTAGLYYLSGSTAGKLVKQRPPVGVPVLRADGQGRVYVNPTVRDSLDDHRHYHFDLVCRPAGRTSPPSPGGTHHIIGADASLPGWLPADHASFEGKAPNNARFGYNLSQAPWRNLWPPIPVSSAYLEVHRGEDKKLNGQGVPLGSDGLCEINADGIWWLSDCYEDVPWPAALDTSDPETEPNVDQSDEVECPRNLYMRLQLWFTRVIFKTSQTVVTSLRAKEGSRITVTCYPTGLDAETGDLWLDLNLDFVVGSDDTLGHIVFKELDGLEFQRGVVTEGIIAATDNVTITSTASRRQTPGNTSTPLVHQGIVSLSVNTDINGNELTPDTVRLGGVTEEFYLDLPTLAFPPNRQTEIRGTIHVPATQIAAGSRMKLRMWLMGRVDGTLPDFYTSFRRLPKPTTPTAVASSDTTLSTLTGVAIDADQYVQLETDTFSIAAGDVIFFTLRRLSDAYNGEIHLLKLRGVISTS